MRAVIELIKGDITKIKVDAVVNAANTTLLGGGGVDGAIHRAAGPQLLVECRGLGGCPTGEAKITHGYSLPARHVIHTVGPVWQGGGHNEEGLLQRCYRNSLVLAESYQLRSVAFPSISTGAYRFPIQRAAPIALSTTRSFLEENPRSLQRVVLVLFSDDDFQLYLRLYKKLIAQE